MLKPTLFYLCIPALAALPLLCQTATLRPKDEAAKDPTFVQFRAGLLRSIRIRDSKALIKLIHSTTQISFGGSRGPEDFIDWWHPEDPNSKVWKELETILMLGGVFNAEGQFEAPYVSSTWPEEYDAFLHSTITGKNVPFYPKPIQGIKPTALLTYDIVRTSVDDSNFSEFEALLKKGWRKVELLNGKVGYVRSKFVRGACDQRVYFSKDENGSWFINAFIAGD